MKFIKVLLLGALGITGLTSPVLSYAGNSACSNGGTKLPETGICTSDASKLLNTVKILNEDGSTHIAKSADAGMLMDGCKWAVNETAMAGGEYLLYRAAHCKGKTAKLEFAGGAHFANLNLIWSALANQKTDEKLVTIGSADAKDPKKNILFYAKEAIDNLKEAKACHVRSAKLAGWPVDALVVDKLTAKQAEKAAEDGPRSSCGPLGNDDDEAFYWRVMHGFSWFFTPTQDAYQDIDLNSLTIIQQAAGGKWINASKVKHTTNKKNKQISTVENDTYRMGKSCPKAGSLVSPNSNQAATIQFTNKTGRAATIYWLDFKGKPVEMGIFENGKASFDSYVGHAFIVKDFDGTCYGGPYIVKAGHSKFSVSSGKSKKKQLSSKATRIKFARGAFSTIVTGKLNGFKSEESYVIGVGKGQTLNIEQIDRQGSQYVSTYITAPNGKNANDMDASCHSQATVSPTVAGDYKIKVAECQKADPWKGRYSLKVTVK